MQDVIVPNSSLTRACVQPRVLQLIETGGAGGAETFVVRMACALRARGVENDIMLLRRGWLSEQLEAQGFAPLIVPEPRWMKPATWAPFLRVIRQRGINVIHSHEFLMNCFGLGLARLSGAAHIATVHGCNYYPERRHRRWAYRLVRDHSHMVAVSNHTRTFVMGQLGEGRAPVHVVPNGLPLERYENAGLRSQVLRSELGLAPETMLFGAVGSLYPVKGHDVLIDAFAQLHNRCPQAHLVIVGRGGEHDRLQQRIERHGLQQCVHLLGLRDDIAAVLSDLDTFVMPSRQEGLPMALLEAMASRRPVVASAVGGIPELIQSGVNGLLVPPDDPTELANAMLRCAEQAQWAGQMGQAGRRTVEQSYSAARMTEAYLELYQQARGQQ